MECYRTKDGTVAKYIHDDGSETAIKTTPSIKFGGNYGNVTNKFNVFISYSVGCPVGCKFCYLTVKKCPYYKLSSEQIVANVLKAIRAEILVRPDLQNMYCKLSWMGMGDACFDAKLTFEATCDIINGIFKYKLCKGIDGVDVASTLPRKLKHIGYINDLHNLIGQPDLNPKRKYQSPWECVRFFYSLHSAVNTTRERLIPNSLSLEEAKEIIGEIKVRLFVHHMLFERINDSTKELEKLISFMQSPFISGAELRLLRFNACEGTDFVESKEFNSIVKWLYSNYDNIKVQSSPGSEVKAACGQFLLSVIR